MQAHEPKTVEVDFRTLQNGWIAATCDAAPAMFVADTTRGGVDELVPEALRETCADKEHSCEIELVHAGEHRSTFRIIPRD